MSNRRKVKGMSHQAMLLRVRSHFRRAMTELNAAGALLKGIPPKDASGDLAAKMADFNRALDAARKAGMDLLAAVAAEHNE